MYIIFLDPPSIQHSPCIYYTFISSLVFNDSNYAQHYKHLYYMYVCI